MAKHRSWSLADEMYRPGKSTVDEIARDAVTKLLWRCRDPNYNHSAWMDEVEQWIIHGDEGRGSTVIEMTIRRSAAWRGLPSSRSPPVIVHEILNGQPSALLRSARELRFVCGEAKRQGNMQV